MMFKGILAAAAVASGVATVGGLETAAAPAGDEHERRQGWLVAFHLAGTRRTPVYVGRPMQARGLIVRHRFGHKRRFLQFLCSLVASNEPRSLCTCMA